MAECITLCRLQLLIPVGASHPPSTSALVSCIEPALLLVSVPTPAIATRIRKVVT